MGIATQPQANSFDYPRLPPSNLRFAVNCYIVATYLDLLDIADAIIISALFYLSIHNFAGSFESEPQYASAIAPFGQQAVLYCKAGQGFFIAKWEVSIPSRKLNTNVPSDVNILRTLGITVNSSSSNESSIIINATQANNGIQIRCELLDTRTSLISRQSSVITTQFYGMLNHILIKSRIIVEFSLCLLFFRSSSSSY